MSRVPDADQLDQALTRILTYPGVEASAIYPNPHQTDARRAHQLTAMTREIEDLQQRVRPFTDAGEAMLHRLAEEFPQAQWDRGRGMFLGTLTEAEPAEQMAARLHLREDNRFPGAERRWTGLVDGWRVSLLFTHGEHALAS